MVLLLEKLGSLFWKILAKYFVAKKKLYFVKTDKGVSAKYD